MPATLGLRKWSCLAETSSGRQQCRPARGQWEAAKCNYHMQHCAHLPGTPACPAPSPRCEPPTYRCNTHAVRQAVGLLMWLTSCRSILWTHRLHRMLATQLPMAARLLLSQHCGAGAQFLMVPSSLERVFLTVCRCSQAHTRLRSCGRGAHRDGFSEGRPDLPLHMSLTCMRRQLCRQRHHPGKGTLSTTQAVHCITLNLRLRRAGTW